MKNKRISIVTLLFVSTILLLFSNTVNYVLLMKKNKDWKEEALKININSSLVAEAMIGHVYYDGDTIPPNQIVRHYNHSGRMIGEKKLEEVLKGDKVVMLLSSNCCSSCVTGEITKLKELSNKIGNEHLIVVADFALHMQPSLSTYYGYKDFYETDVEHLGLKGSPTRETPVVMLVQDGRVKTSFPVGPQSSNYVNSFHDFLIDYFNEKG